MPYEELSRTLLTSDLEMRSPNEPILCEPGLASQIGRRRAYAEFAKQQCGMDRNGLCHVSYYAFCTHFKFKKVSSLRQRQRLSHPAPLAKMTKDQSCLLKGNDDKKSNKFIIGDIVYTKLLSNKQLVVVPAPYFTLNDDCPKSCYSILLMHLPWDPLGEKGLLLDKTQQPYDSPVSAYQEKEYLLPNYVQPLLAQHKESQERRAEDQLQEDGYDGDTGRYGDHDDDSNDDFDDGENDNDAFNNEIPSSEVPEGPAVVTLAGASQSLTSKRKTEIKHFVQVQQALAMAAYEKRNQIPNTNTTTNMTGSYQYQSLQKYPNHSELVVKYNESVQKCGVEQKQTLQSIVEKMKKDPAKNKEDQIISFISGEGGTGKTFLIKLLRLKALIVYGMTGGTHEPLVPLGPTGSSANTNDGFTWQSLFFVEKAKGSGGATQKGACMLATR